MGAKMHSVGKKRTKLRHVGFISDYKCFALYTLQYFTISVSKQEVERLLQLFKEFTKTMTNEIKRGKGGIDRNRFRDILHQHFDMTDDVLMDKGKIWSDSMSMFLFYKIGNHFEMAWMYDVVVSETNCQIIIGIDLSLW